MTSKLRLALTLLCAVGLAGGGRLRAEEPQAPDAPAASEKYLLRYHFQPGETLRWQVEHRAQVRTTVGGTTQTAETTSGSIKAWEVTAVDGQGQATFVHRVESVDMKQKLTGRQEVTYNSQTDAQPPVGFEDVAKAVGVPLSVITLDARGTIVKREQKQAQPGPAGGQITLPLPDQEVAVGDTWSYPYDVDVKLKDGASKTVKTRQQFTLTEVDRGMATIRVATQVLTPIRDPALEAQLIQHESDGTVRFDIAAGRVRSQQTDLDKRVVGFQGEASSLHYVTRFTEELLPEKSAATAAKKPAAGPAPPPTAATKNGPKSPAKTAQAPATRTAPPRSTTKPAAPQSKVSSKPAAKSGATQSPSGSSNQARQSAPTGDGKAATGGKPQPKRR